MPIPTNASIRVRLIGGMRTALEAEHVAEALGHVDDNAGAAGRAAVYASFGLRRMGTELRRIAVAGQIAAASLWSFTGATTVAQVTTLSLASIALPALALSLWGVAVAASVVVAALIGGFLAILGAAGVMALGVVDRFMLMRDVAGSAANDLFNQALGLRGAFRDAVGPGADALMKGLADGLTALIPLMAELAPSFTALGGAFGDMFRDVLVRLAQMGPQLNAMFAALIPAIDAGGDFLSTFVALMVQIATVGAPLVADALRWLTGLMDGLIKSFDLRTAEQTLRSFAANVRIFVAALVAPLRGVLGPAIADMNANWAEMGPLVGRLIGQLIAGFVQFGQQVLPIVTSGMRILSGLLGDNGETVKTLLGLYVGLRIGLKAAAAAMAIYRTVVGLGAAATWLLNAALLANPIVLIVMAVLLLAGALVLAYYKVGWFRNAVNGVFNWIKEHWHLLVAVFFGPIVTATTLIASRWDDIVDFMKRLPGRIAGAASGMWDFMTTSLELAVNGVKRIFIGVINWIIGKINSVIDRLNSTVGKIPFTPDLGTISPIAPPADSPGSGDRPPDGRGGGVVPRGGPESPTSPGGGGNPFSGATGSGRGTASGGDSVVPGVVVARSGRRQPIHLPLVVNGRQFGMAITEIDLDDEDRR